MVSWLSNTRRDKATIWGREVDLCISIAPLETPTEKLPIIEEKSAKGKNELLLPEQQAYVDELKKKIKALKKLLPPKVDEALEQRYLDYMNAERIKAIIQDAPRYGATRICPLKKKSVSSFLIKLNYMTLCVMSNCRMI